MESFLNEDEDDSYDELLRQLKKRYVDPQQLATARSEYSALKQLNKDLATFLSDFYRLAAATKVPEDWQMNDLWNKLNNRFNNRIAGQTFYSLFDMIHTLEQIDSH